ncbi:MAG: 50S ribosomal protein L6 [Candidatus Aenigmatarchaeota archaeon]
MFTNTKTEKIYKEEIEIPEDVKIEIKDNKIFVEGKFGKTYKEIKHISLNKIIFFKIENNKFIAYTLKTRKEYIAMVNTIIAHVRNLIEGVTKGYEYVMKIVYSHFPIKIEIKEGKVFIYNFLGEKRPRIANIVGNTKVELKENYLIVSGNNIEEVGQTCNNIEQATRISKWDRRVFQDGIFLIERRNIIKE